MLNKAKFTNNLSNESARKRRYLAASLELKNLRKAFFDLRYNEQGHLIGNGGEFDYLIDALAESETKRETFGKLTRLDPEVRLFLTKRRLEAIEYGEVKAENLDQAELEIGMLLGSMYPFGVGDGSGVNSQTNDGNGGNGADHSVLTHLHKKQTPANLAPLTPRYVPEPSRNDDRDVYMDR